MLSVFAAVILFCVGPVTLTQGAVKLSDFVSPCSLKDPKLNDCLTTQSRALIPHLVAGVKDWGTPRMDPLFVPFIQLQRGTSGALGISINVTNSTQDGWRKIQINSVKLNPKDFKFEVTLFLPFYNMEGLSTTQGQFLSIPIYGEGFANLTFVDNDIKMTMQCKPEERAGQTYLKIAAMKVDARPKRFTVMIDNLFKNKILSDNMNKFINDHDQEAFQEFKPDIEEIFSGIMSNTLSRMFSKIPLKQLFKDVD